MELHEQGFEAYCQGLKGKQIAVIVGKTEQTITAWSKKYNWELRRQKKLISRENAEEGVWQLFNYNVRILLRIAKKHEEKEEQNPELSIKELQEMLTSKGDVDALQKLHTTIKGKPTTWGECIRIAQEQLEYFQQHHLEAAKILAPLMDEWLSQKRKEL
tara:strand:- start:40 stop:516 length:477 start_codon:yes stop_codon:yes gene_type:complete